MLGLRPGATPAEIKAAYLGLAKRHHPDRSRGHDDSHFKRVAEAYAALTTPVQSSARGGPAGSRTGTGGETERERYYRVYMQGTPVGPSPSLLHSAGDSLRFPCARFGQRETRLLDVASEPSFSSCRSHPPPQRIASVASNRGLLARG